MRRLSTLALFCLVLYSLFARVGAAPSGGIEGENSNGELVDIKADLVFPYKVNDTLSVLCLVGNFAAQHNGAVITADSAVRYDNDRLECFGNVLINKNTTYAYCDHADYDTDNNLATLFSRIVKVVDEDVTLYTYNFEFNTLDNIGRYWGDGLTMKLVATEEGEEGEEIEPSYDIMESRRGYYYADSKSVVGVEDVELEGAGYQMKGDSVIYDMQSEKAHFFGATDIWSEDEYYIFGDAGLYDKAEERYSVTKNSYLLTTDQEVWSDSMEYYRAREEAILRRNIQIIDTTNKSIAFADYAQYWGVDERVFMTRDPLLINYDTQNPEQPIDTLYLRGDTIEVHSYALGTGPFTGEASSKKEYIPEGISELMSADTTASTAVDEIVEMEEDDVHDHEHGHDHHHDHEPTIIADSTTTAEPVLSKRDIKEQEREAKELARVTAEEAREFRKLESRRDKVSARIDKRIEKGKDIYSDSMLLLRIMAEIDNYNKVADTLKVDSAAVDSAVTEEMAQVDSLPSRDSLYRVFFAYGNVRSYRRDFQMVCDSMVANSYDTVMNLYVAPILWSDKNQVTAEKMDFYTKDGDLDYADFIGNPIMASLVIPTDTMYINQVVGKEMRAFFENNNVVRNDVNSNVQTIYYMQDENTLEVNTIAFIESGSATFLIENQQLDGVIYRQSPLYTFAPIDRRPVNVPLYLDNFIWVESRRPTLSSIMNRTMRPSEREQRSSVPRPTFPIQKRIDSDRARLERGKLWTDRMELVSPDATEWMESLGFTPGQPRPEGSGF